MSNWVGLRVLFPCRRGPLGRRLGLLAQMLLNLALDRAGPHIQRANVKKHAAAQRAACQTEQNRWNVHASPVSA